ncbi:hypothetical protein [Spongiimicrobium salis]|uniref:hypothetical protein n=1 Tax=Spongiimicrobium salis TaxID=1667022 RepID=UPI00374DEC14
MEKLKNLKQFRILDKKQLLSITGGTTTPPPPPNCGVVAGVTGTDPRCPGQVG